MRSEIYGKQGADLKKLWLRFFPKAYLLLLSILGGAVLGACIYLGYHRIHDGEVYQTTSKLYLDFAVDETGEVYQYYNGYTWNDLMKTDPIITETMKGLNDLSISTKEVEEATQATILSDIRLLTITITASDQEICERIKLATEASLVSLGDHAKEFVDIRVIRSEEPARLYADNRICQAILLGVILASFICLFSMLFYYLLDDRIYVPGDLEQVEHCRFLGICHQGEKLLSKDPSADIVNSMRGSELKKNLDHMTEGKTAFVINAKDSQKDALSSLDHELMRTADIVFVEIPFGKVTASYLRYLCTYLENQDVKEIACWITEGNRKFFDRYYFGRK